MSGNQPQSEQIKLKKSTKLGKEILDKYKPKKDLNRKATSYMEKHLSIKSIVRFETCHEFMHFLTTETLDKKRLKTANSCGNRFCPICTWKKAKKDAIKISVLMESITVKENYEYIFLTLTSPNVDEEDLASEIDKFNHAINKLFKRRNVEKIVQGYVRKLEVTTDQEKYITKELYRRKGNYFKKHGLEVGNPNPQYNTYNPHLHVILAVKKNYFDDKKNYISQSEWLSMWKECMQDERITQVDVKKVRTSENSKSNAVLEIAKYSAKGSDLYHSERVFDTFYIALKKRQLLVYGGKFKEYAKKYDKGELDEFKATDEAIYTHLLKSLWNNSKYENRLRELTPEEFKKYNERALKIEEDDEIE